MILFPNAKINLGLEITSRRADGYHNLDTVFYPVDWHDILEIVPAKQDECTLTVTGNAVDCPPEKNLVMRAWNVMNAHVPIPPVDIYLHKIIPDGAGLGGGSADAAFTLIGLNSIFKLGLPDTTLAEFAAEIGADCPFFIYNRPLRATGIGNIFTPVELSLAQYKLLIVKPPVSVSTKLAYSGVTPHQPARELTEMLSLSLEEWNGVVENRFEKSVFHQFPLIARVKQQLLDAGAVYASMSGSGASVYAIYSKDRADNMSALVSTLPLEFISHVSDMKH